MKIIIQGFVITYDTVTGIVENVGLDVQQESGATRTVTTTKPEIVGFIQKIVDAWLGK